MVQVYTSAYNSKRECYICVVCFQSIIVWSVNAFNEYEFSLPQLRVRDGSHVKIPVWNSSNLFQQSHLSTAKPGKYIIKIKSITCYFSCYKKHLSRSMMSAGGEKRWKYNQISLMNCTNSHRFACMWTWGRPISNYVISSLLSIVTDRLAI